MDAKSAGLFTHPLAHSLVPNCLLARSLDPELMVSIHKKVFRLASFSCHQEIVVSHENFAHIHQLQATKKLHIPTGGTWSGIKSDDPGPTSLQILSNFVAENNLRLVDIFNRSVPGRRKRKRTRSAGSAAFAFVVGRVLEVGAVGCVSRFQIGGLDSYW